MAKVATVVLFVSVVVAVVIADGNEPNCPGFAEKECPLYYKINDCCAQSDCRSGDVCCVQPCGNVCRRISPTPIGTPLKDGTECELGHVFPKAWYEKLWEKISG